MTFLLRRTPALALILAGIFALLFATLTPAHAGTIGCGNQQFGFFNRTYPSAQIHLVGRAPTGPIQGCSQYSDILTVYGDTVWLDYTGGAYMKLGPRTACDYSTFSNGYIRTMRNPTYTTTYYQSVEDYDQSSITIWKCTNY